MRGEGASESRTKRSIFFSLFDGENGDGTKTILDFHVHRLAQTLGTHATACEEAEVRRGEDHGNISSAVSRRAPSLSSLPNAPAGNLLSSTLLLLLGSDSDGPSSALHHRQAESRRKLMGMSSSYLTQTGVMRLLPWTDDSFWRARVLSGEKSVDSLLSALCRFAKSSSTGTCRVAAPNCLVH